jgi:hypothetical protein
VKEEIVMTFIRKNQNERERVFSLIRRLKRGILLFSLKERSRYSLGEREQKGDERWKTRYPTTRGERTLRAFRYFFTSLLNMPHTFMPDFFVLCFVSVFLTRRGWTHTDTN